MEGLIWFLLGMIVGGASMWIFSWITDIRSYWKMGKKGISYGIKKGSEYLDKRKQPSIKELMVQYPNDMEFGKIVRELNSKKVEE